ncbi:acyltransferase family protein [Oceanicella actignis]|uniref:Peptidoglycan/LPS O-acetylase OafA/YrhL, contains acyltransferase and SGNH-hydrolase domains n=1 Tax=Oceanicella actignis TaxID=1189325 RepID=A0A1M7RYN6_9RHOB|nr:acyltransferase [Oceanicella actignis]SES97059.1 Peptidoglycan/LPS O-acetylase OafA/YrhL, contains acyltransferase and SGNH-hydrolase domains [Oceanicella actignis]SHN51270.1 Peptidoglycan/LPS O-acetylase OafA/YrhL, contains acyltransferase and SGNH-hydrolase domains [Oceanicella actignis]
MPAHAPPTRQATQGARWPGVDALRALGIAMVVVYHYFDRWDWTYLGFSAPRGFSFPGWLGVDLFFIVSAFCIASTLGRARTAARFVALRLARLWPAYAAAVALTTAVCWAFPLPGRTPELWQALANMLWLNALSPLVPHVDGAYWSLIVELQFYVLLALAHFRLGARGGLIFWCLFTLAGAGAEALSEPLARRALIFPYSAMFLFGLILWRWDETGPRLRLAALAIALGGAMISSRYAGVEAPLAALMALAAATMRRGRRLGAAPLTLIGLTSYTWYLTHQNIGLVIIRELNAAGLERISVPAAAAGTFALALALSRLIELRWRAPLANALEGALARLPFFSDPAPAEARARHGARP